MQKCVGDIVKFVLAKLKQAYVQYGFPSLAPFRTGAYQLKIISAALLFSAAFIDKRLYGKGLATRD